MADWGFLAGYLRSLKKDLLDAPALGRLLETGSEMAFLKAVEDSSYGSWFTAGNIAHYDQIFEKHLLEIFSRLEQLLPGDPLLRLQRLPYDLANMKLVYKTKARGDSMKWESLSENGTLQPEDLYTIIEDKLYFKLPGAFDRAFRELDEILHHFPDDQIVDFRIDQAAVEYRYELLKDMPEYQALLPLLSAQADLENIKNSLRARKLSIDRNLFRYILLEHGSIPRDRFENWFSESLEDLAEHIRDSRYGTALAEGLDSLLDKKGFSLLEKLMDQYLMGVVNSYQYIASGPLVLAEYLELKHMEIKNLTILFIGKLNNLAADQIKTRLRSYAV